MQLELLRRAPTHRNVRQPPLLFVHGSSHAAWCWDEHFLPWFAAAGFDSYAVSLRGHGTSDGGKQLRWTSVHDYVSDVRSIVVSLPGLPVLIGHSLGGLVVQKYLEQYVAAGAVLLAPSPARGMLRSGFRLFCRHPLLFAKVYARLDPGQLYCTSAHVREFLFSKHAAQAVIDDCTRRLGRESFRAMLDMTYSRPRVARIRRQCPMLIVGGAVDVIVPPTELEDTAAAYGAPFKILPETGHNLMLDAAWPLVAERIEVWLTDTMPHAVL